MTHPRVVATCANSLYRADGTIIFDLNGHRTWYLLRVIGGRCSGMSHGGPLGCPAIRPTIGRTFQFLSVTLNNNATQPINQVVIHRPFVLCSLTLLSQPRYPTRYITSHIVERTTVRDSRPFIEIILVS
jgi:hypothetical protein